jgi:hypothetical protein
MAEDSRARRGSPKILQNFELFSAAVGGWLSTGYPLAHMTSTSQKRLTDYADCAG